MPAIKQLKVPQSAVELIKDPQRVADAFMLLNLLLSAQVEVTMPNSTRGVESIVVSGQNILIPIPLKLSTAIADASATALSASTQLNLLLAALRRTRQLPS
jgi:hypothetical protein